MNTFCCLRLVMLLVGVALASAVGQVPAAAQPRSEPVGRVASTGGAQPVLDETALLAQLESAIKGKENERAATVFKNVRLLGDMPAGRLLRVMQVGYARSLGVSCDHCHDAADWSSDAKAAKRITRGMSRLVDDLNGRGLKEVEGLADRKAVVNCTTCHRGEIKPALSLPAKPAPQA